jgi:hypothetical protein
MQHIKRLLFGKRREPVDVISTGLRTICLKNQPTFEEWCKEFKVSMLHDRKPIHIEDGEASTS